MLCLVVRAFGDVGAGTRAWADGCKARVSRDSGESHGSANRAADVDRSAAGNTEHPLAMYGLQAGLVGSYFRAGACGMDDLTACATLDASTSQRKG